MQGPHRGETAPSPTSLSNGIQAANAGSQSAGISLARIHVHHHLLTFWQHSCRVAEAFVSSDTLSGLFFVSLVEAHKPKTASLNPEKDPCKCWKLHATSKSVSSSVAFISSWTIFWAARDNSEKCFFLSKPPWNKLDS